MAFPTGAINLKAVCDAYGVASNMGALRGLVYSTDSAGTIPITIPNSGVNLNDLRTKYAQLFKILANIEKIDPPIRLDITLSGSTVTHITNYAVRMLLLGIKYKYAQNKITSISFDEVRILSSFFKVSNDFDLFDKVDIFLSVKVDDGTFVYLIREYNVKLKTYTKTNVIQNDLNCYSTLEIYCAVNIYDIWYSLRNVGQSLPTILSYKKFTVSNNTLIPV